MSETYDIVVIGGGIHGVGVAQAAAARGYKTVLLEQTNLASGTSSRSSKLIHGGLRYLETAQFSLVRECLRERALLLKLAPELVRLQPFYIPVYPTTQRRPWQLRIGLMLYKILTGISKAGHFNIMPRNSWDTLDGLDIKDMQAVFRYWDAQTDDAALTRAVARSALDLGAELLIPAVFISAHLHKSGCTVRYQKDGKDYTCECSVIVNASGPWVNRVLDRITPVPDKMEIELVQGTHILIEGQLTQGIYYLEAPQDQRAVFAMPWHNRILIGTTESPYRGTPAEVKPLPHEQAYLLATFGHYFPDYGSLRQSDIITSYAGLRVLPASEDSAFLRSRETTVYTDRVVRPRVMSIYGGKLTTYRATAEKVMNQLIRSLPQRKIIADTKELALTPV